MSFSSELLKPYNSNFEFDAKVSLRAPTLPIRSSGTQWSQSTPEFSNSIARIVDIYEFIPAAHRCPAYYLSISDGNRFCVAVTPESELSRWRSVMPPLSVHNGRSTRAAVLSVHGMIPPSPESLDRNLLRYIFQVNGTDHVSHVTKITFQGRGPVLKVPRSMVPPLRALLIGEKGDEPVQHDSFYDMSQRTSICVSVRAPKFRPIEDTDDDSWDDLSDTEFDSHARRMSIESLPSDFEIPGSIPPCDSTDSSGSECFSSP